MYRARPIAGGLFAAGPLATAAAVGMIPDQPTVPRALTYLVAIAAGAGISAAGVFLDSRRKLGRAVGTIALPLCVLSMAEAIVGSPLSVFLALLLLAAALVALRTDSRVQSPAQATRGFRALEWARSASGVALIGFVVSLVQVTRGTLADWCTAASMLAALGAAFAALLLVPAKKTWRKLLLALALALLIVGGALLALVAWPLMTAAWAVALVLVFAVTHRLAIGISGVASPWVESLLGTPARLIVFTFLALCLAGAALLTASLAASPGREIALVDAAFTAVSAVCVTGLVVLDTARDFSVAGQVMITVLIQLGGLGIMTLSVAALGLLGRRLGVRSEAAFAGAVSGENRGSLFSAVRRVLVVTFACELGGVAALTPLFAASGQSWSQSLGHAVFTSISAFCNAGFALRSENLVAYQTSFGVLQVVALLIILGGLSPAVVLALPALARRRLVPLQAKLGLIVTVLLIAVGTAFYATMEWSASLQGLSFFDKLSNAYFQSVTTRTAGFNSVDMNAVRPETATWIIAWMYIGGCPGGTAGGIKTTTFAILVLAVVSAIRGRFRVVAFRRAIPDPTVYKAAAIATAMIAAGFAFVLAIELTQRLSPLAAAFEVFSALGTVGLSIGGTAQLDSIGKIMIMICMFIGRVGPLTLFAFLAERNTRDVWQEPIEEVDVG